MFLFRLRLAGKERLTLLCDLERPLFLPPLLLHFFLLPLFLSRMSRLPTFFSPLLLFLFRLPSLLFPFECPPISTFSSSSPTFFRPLIHLFPLNIFSSSPPNPISSYSSSLPLLVLPYAVTEASLAFFFLRRTDPEAKCAIKWVLCYAALFQPFSRQTRSSDWYGAQACSLVVNLRDTMSEFGERGAPPSPPGL